MNIIKYDDSTVEFVASNGVVNPENSFLYRGVGFAKIDELFSWFYRCTGVPVEAFYSAEELRKYLWTRKIV